MSGSGQRERDSLGERLAALRLKKRWTQKELAARAGVSVTRVRKYERGVHRMDAEALVRLAGALGVTLDHLIHGSEPRRLHDPRFHVCLEQLDELPEEARKCVAGFLDTFLRAFQLIDQATKEGDWFPLAGADGETTWEAVIVTPRRPPGSSLNSPTPSAGAPPPSRSRPS